LSRKLLDTAETHGAHSSEHGLAPVAQAQFHFFFLCGSQTRMTQLINNPRTHRVLNPDAYVGMKTTTSLRFHRAEEGLHNTEKPRRHQSSCCTISKSLASVNIDANEVLQVQADHHVRKNSLRKRIL
jgi:hypothetical protein